MQNVMSFSSDKHEKYCRCSRCFGETNHVKIKHDNLDFGELLHKEIKNVRWCIK